MAITRFYLGFSSIWFSFQRTILYHEELLPQNWTTNCQQSMNGINPFFLRKEVIQPHLPIRLPCYDFTPIIYPTLGGWLLKGYLTDFGCYKLSWCDGRCVQGPGTYSPRHADPRLLAIPASCRRVAAYNPNWEWFYGIGSTSRFCCPLYHPL